VGYFYGEWCLVAGWRYFAGLLITRWRLHVRTNLGLDSDLDWKKCVGDAVGRVAVLLFVFKIHHVFPVQYCIPKRTNKQTADHTLLDFHHRTYYLVLPLGTHL
jgi:hypothetical protein